MNIKRFFAHTSREAMSQVRLALGADAIILSNRAVEGGNEILAVNEQDMDQMVSLGETVGAANPAPAFSPNVQRQLDILTRKPVSAHPEAAEDIPVHKPAADAAISEQEAVSIKQEIKMMREMLQSQLNELSWNSMAQRDPMKSMLLSSMLSAGFSASLSRLVAEKAPVFTNRADAIKWLKNALSANIKTISNENSLLDQGGVFALIGPTGVGKTTTTAKLAARYVMKHGTRNLALITTDGYRIGGHEQLRIYGKILGVMVHAVKDQQDLKLALQELKGKHTILIDTVGVSQRDNMVAQQIAMLNGTGGNIKKLLCLNATCTGETLSDVVRAYKGKGIDGAIITKIDEAASIGGALDIVIREKLRLHYVTNGQRVPEDIVIADKEKLLMHAIKLGISKQSFNNFHQDELPALMARTPAFSSQTASMEVNHV